MNDRSDAIISVRDLSKVFRVHKRREGLAGAVRYLFSREFEEIRAVDGVSFDVYKGESVGYIGKGGTWGSSHVAFDWEAVE